MSAPFKITCIITPTPGKEERFIEIFNKCAIYAEANEPGTLQYELCKARVDPAGPVTDFVIKEVYADKEAFDKHMNHQNVKDFVASIQSEGLVKDSKLLFSEKQRVGFATRL